MEIHELHFLKTFQQALLDKIQGKKLSFFHYLPVYSKMLERLGGVRGWGEYC